MQTESLIPSAQTPSPRSRPRWLWLAVLGVVVLLLLVEVGYQLWKSSPAATSPSVAGRPLSNPQTHLHTVALFQYPQRVESPCCSQAPARPMQAYHTQRQETMYLGTHFGLFWSTDGGHTWPQQAGVLPGLMITSVAVSPVDPNTVAVAGLSNGGDASRNGFYISQDGGATWHLRSPSLPGSGLGAPASPYFVQAGADAAGHWYVVFVGAGLYETRDAGAHWTPLTPPGMANTLMTSLALDPTDTNHVLLGTDAGLYATRDDGAHWQQSPEVRQSVLALAALPGSPQVILCATSAGLWRSVDQGAHFQDVSARAFNRLTVSGTQQAMLYGVSGQQIWRSPDQGSHWTLAATLDRSDLTALVGDPANAQMVYVGYFYPPAVFSSRDAGHSWQTLTA